MKDVKVLVSSCACNQKFLTLVEKVVKENGIDAKVSAVSDIMEQMQYNVMSLPALVVDGQVVARGQKSEKELIQLLKYPNYHEKSIIVNGGLHDGNRHAGTACGGSLFPRQAALHHMPQHREMCEGSAGREFCLPAEEQEDKYEGH